MEDYKKPHESYERYLGKDNGGFPVRVIKLARDIRKLRELLWLNHDRTRTHVMYGDDGEMDCNTCMIDFRRDPVDEIANKITSSQTRKRYQKAAQNNLTEILKNKEEIEITKEP